MPLGYVVFPISKGTSGGDDQHSETFDAGGAGLCARDPEVLMCCEGLNKDRDTTFSEFKVLILLLTGVRLIINCNKLSVTRGSTDQPKQQVSVLVIYETRLCSACLVVLEGCQIQSTCYTCLTFLGLMTSL